jgi:hypothetical protein
MKEGWNKVSREHVLEAIQKYDRAEIDAPRPRNTFLLHEGQRYPAKHIRGMAFELATGNPIRKDEYSGGAETANFLRSLGFEVHYEANEIKKLPGGEQKKLSGDHLPGLSVVTQKTAFQRLLQIKLGILESEKKYPWLKTPDKAALPAEYQKIYSALIEDCGSESFIKSNYPLSIDFCIEERRLLFEYDERQHFTLPRKISLQNYGSDVKLGYPSMDWIRYCEIINAKDGNPPLRDSGRALFDSVRDIEASNNGYQLVRIRHGEFDWANPGAGEYLDIVLDRARGNEPKGNDTPENRHYSLGPEKEIHMDYNFRSLEIEFQRIRLNFMKWLFYFTPPEHEIYNGSGCADSFKLFQSPFGRSFSLFPCGLGSVYTGGGKGNVKLPSSCFSSKDDLLRETAEIRSSLDYKIDNLRRVISDLLRKKDEAAAWSMIQNYFWLKLGLHEYTFDAHYYEDKDIGRFEGEDVRGIAVKAMRMSLDLGKGVPVTVNVDRPEHMLGYKFGWKKYAICSFDCGPIAWGKERFVPYSEIAQQRQAWDSAHREEFQSLFRNEDKNKRREYALASLTENHHIEVRYDIAPLEEATQYGGFLRNRKQIRDIIERTQENLNELITSEKLPLRTTSYLPKGR